MDFTPSNKIKQNALHVPPIPYVLMDRLVLIQDTGGLITSQQLYSLVSILVHVFKQMILNAVGVMEATYVTSVLCIMEVIITEVKHLFALSALIRLLNL
jgi:hypothetical protein